MSFFKCAVWSIVVTAVFSEVCNNNYYVETGCDKEYGNVLGTLTDIHSITECSLRCTRHEHCLSVKYSIAEEVCKLNSEGYTPLDTSCSALSMFSRLIKKSCRKLINEECSAGAECSVTNSQCVSNKCQCDPGYSYKYTGEMCVTSCDVYGHTFTEHPGNKLKGNNLKTVTSVTNAGVCETACAAESEFVCRSFNFYSKTDTCRLSNETALTAPLDYSSSSDGSYFNRDCQ